MREVLRFIHAADLHLDSPFKGLSAVPDNIFQDIKSSTFKALKRLIDDAIECQVDFVLIAGDLFDEESRSLKAQLKLRKELERLREHGIQVFISHGNHDPVGGDYLEVKWPENVHVFPDERIRSIPYIKNGRHLANIYGFSYETRAIHDAKINEYMADSNPDIYHIGMLHGSLAANKEHDVYAPFRHSDFDGKGMDYWALGHIHKREILRKAPYAVYPGNIQGRHMKEHGEKGCYLVELSDQHTELTFMPTQTIRFETFHLDALHYQSIDQLEQWIQKEKRTWRKDYEKAVVRLHMKIDQEKINQLHEEEMKELVDLLNESEEEETRWIWIEKIRTDVKVSWKREELIQGKHFTGELLRQIDQIKNPEPFLEELTENRTVKKFLDPFTEEELQEIMNEAENLLLEHLLKD
ncbi:MAG: DNA repair exonuclease [Bacillaceae bacterium]|nr:DNA repair exonuclease [Bacillaceae bacterium]